MTTIRVRFPDGVREVPAHYRGAGLYRGFDARGPIEREVSILEPLPRDGWRFRQFIGQDADGCSWAAMRDELP